MNRKHTPGGVYPFELFYEEGEIEQICVDALKRCGLLPTDPQPVRIERFFDKHFPNCVTHYEDVGPGILGGIVFRPDGEVEAVFVSKLLADDPSPTAQRRLRATFAHEGGHGLLHGCLFIDDGQMDLLGTRSTDARRILCRDEDVAPARGSMRQLRWWEVQANRAIGGLLLPSELVQTAVRRFAREVDPFGGLALIESQREAAIKEVSGCFDVSASVARIRLERLFRSSAFESLR